MSIYKTINKRIIWKSIAVLIAGVILVYFGICFYTNEPPLWGISLAFLQPVMVDGVVPLILGVGFIIGGTITLYNRKKYVENELSRRREKGKEKQKGFRTIQ